MYNVSIKTDWTLRLLLSVLCLKVQLSYFWHNTQRYFYHIFWWNNEDILKLKVSRGCVGYFKTYLFFFFILKKPKQNTKVKFWNGIWAIKINLYVLLTVIPVHSIIMLCFLSASISSKNVTQMTYTVSRKLKIEIPRPLDSFLQYHNYL